MPIFLIFSFLLAHMTFSQQSVALHWDKIPFELEKQYDLNDSIAVRIDQIKFYVQALNERHMIKINASDRLISITLSKTAQ